MPFTYPVSKPSLGERELEYVTEAVSAGWISAHGPYVPRLEREFAHRNGVEHAVACSSGLGSLMLALRALGIGPGDEVLVPEFTMVATAWAVSYVGATPLFVDCADDLNIDVSLIEQRITPRTKAILPVHVYGRRCDMDAIATLAHEYNLNVVEDMAEAHGVPAVGDIACYSLFANKIITSGEGGICLTGNPRLAAQMAHLRSMAFSNDHSFVHKKFAYNFRMSSMQAAVGIAQLERLDEILAARRSIEQRYDAGLRDVPGITLMPPRDVLWMYDVRAEGRDELREHLGRRGVETRPFFQPMSRQPGYFDPDWTSLNASRFAADGVYLPTYTDLTEAEQDCIVGHVREFYGQS